MKRSVEVDIKLNSREVTEAWCALSADEQAEFFNLLSVLSKDWPLYYQLEQVKQSASLLSEGRYVMQQIGEYSK